MISHEISFVVPLTSFGGLQGMAEKAREVRDSYNGKSSAHYQAWDNLATAIDAMIERARESELSDE